MLFNHLYIEKRVLNHPKTIEIRSKFHKSKIVEIDHYKDIFNRSSQSFLAQSSSKNLILTHKDGKFLHDGSQYSDGFGFKNFFYASSVMGCLYDCSYCYLQGLYPSANTVLALNLEDAFVELEPYLQEPTLVATSYDTDSLAIESLTDQTAQWLQYVSDKEHLHLEIRTKSANTKVFERFKPVSRVVIAFTLSPQEIIDAYEHFTPSLSQRLKAIKKLYESGWRVRVCIDPIIYTDSFSDIYPPLIDEVFKYVNDIEHLTLGGFRMSQSHLRALKKLNRDDIAFFPYKIEDDMVSYPKKIEDFILDTMLQKARSYLDDERIRVWRRQ